MRDYIKYAGILFAITFVTAFLLGVVNKVTSPVIAEYNVKKERNELAKVTQLVRSQATCSTASTK